MQTNDNKYEGVHQCDKTGRWKVFYNFQGKRYHIGSFESFDIAKNIRDDVVQHANTAIQEVINTIETFREKHLATYRDEQFIENTHVGRISSKAINKNNSSGVRGVSWIANRGKWVATIGFKGKHYRLGSFDNLEDAKKARLAAEDKYYSQFLENLDSK